MSVKGRSKSKIIPLNPGAMAARTTDAQTQQDALHDRYMEELSVLSQELCNMARRFGEEPKQVLFDLTYVIVGNDIVDTFLKWDGDTEDT